MNEIISAGLVLATNEGIKEVVKTIVNVYVKPKMEKVCKEVKNQKDFNLIEDKLYEYLEKSYKRYLYMNTIVFKNGQKTINDLYIPLTVKKSDLVNREERIEIYINKYRNELIPKYKRILLVDNAGMGKSTIMKYLYLNAMNEKRGVPILIELRKVDKNVDIVEFIMNEINGIKECFDKKDILTLIERGDFIFLFDGYDEIKEELKESVTKNLQDFIGNALKNEFIISSRDDAALSCFGDFQRFEIEPLKKEEAYELIKKYDNGGELSKELISLLEHEENLKCVREFLDNPLMVSLLYLAYGYRRDLPNGKHIFYDQVYTALFLDHDKSKGGAYVHPKKSNLNIDDFRKVLNVLGFITLKEGISYSRENLLRYLNVAKDKSFGIQFNESDFIYDLEHTVALFVKESNEYRWCHKSFQEYFAACYICYDSREKQEDILLKISMDNLILKYYNVLDFYYDLDYKGFMKTLIYPIIIDMESFYNKTYGNIEYSIYDQKGVNFRKAIQFKYDKIFIKILTDSEKKLLRSNKRGKESNPFEYLRLSIENEYFERSFNEKKATSGNLFNNKLYILYYNNRVTFLLGILYSKGNELVTEIENDDIGSEVIYSLIEKINPKTYEINDDYENILNQEEVFTLLNRYLKRTNVNRVTRKGTIFNYCKCIEFKDSIIHENKLLDDDLDYL